MADGVLGTYAGIEMTYSVLPNGEKMVNVPKGSTSAETLREIASDLENLEVED